jgi:hypothetical protein
VRTAKWRKRDDILFNRWRRFDWSGEHLANSGVPRQRSQNGRRFFGHWLALNSEPFCTIVFLAIPVTNRFTRRLRFHGALYVERRLKHEAPPLHGTEQLAAKG